MFIFPFFKAATISSAKIQKISPELKENLIAELKREWQKAIKDNQRSLTRREEKEKNEIPPEKQELEIFLAKYPNLSEECRAELEGECQKKIKERLNFQRKKEVGKSVEVMTPESFNSLFVKDFDVTYEENVSGSNGTFAQFVVHVGQDFVDACRHDHYEVRDRIQKITCDFLRQKGYSPQKYVPCVSTSIKQSTSQAEPALA